ncbi:MULTISPECIES: DUF4190 domain-containing protein [Gordonia]|nr:DUF4190 domain-containing protein [Gordonia paraffinivorans]MCD2146374.1 DUF4190 domain-containing protein [Gordonia paraffinivorans]PWD44808.1 hypothetical protein ACN93_01875 [Gordonia paraffinivorans]
MSQPPEQGSGNDQDDWGTVPSSGSSSGDHGVNLSKGGQTPPDPTSPEYAPTQFGQAYQPPADPQGQDPYGQSPYGQNAYEQNPYGQPSPDPYAQNPYGQSPYGAAPGSAYGDPYQPGPAYGSAAYGGANPYQAGAYPGYAAPPSTNGKAIASLVCGIAGLVCCGLITGIVAVVLGVMARREVRDSSGRETGDGLALGGIITGTIAIVWSLVFIVLYAVGIGAAILDDSSTSTF